MIDRGSELIRIKPSNSQHLEVSKNDGRSWSIRFTGSVCGDFQDLTDNGNEILATTSKGLYVSKNDGRSWVKR